MNQKLIRQELLEHCHRIVNKKIETYQQAIDVAQHAANAESKSSAGDKYETTRAMMQIERDNHARQLAETLKLKKALDQIKPEHATESVEFGSIIITDKNKYFLSISIGELEVQNQKFIALSPSSPLGRALNGLKPTQTFTFGPLTQTVKTIF